MLQLHSQNLLSHLSSSTLHPHPQLHHHHHHLRLFPHLSPSLLRVQSSNQETQVVIQEVEDVGGPIEISPDASSNIFAVDDNPSPLQVATSVLLTGAITVFLFRSLRRRARRAKELRVRSTGVKNAIKNAKDIREEALESLKAMGVASVETPGAPPSPVQALLGGIGAGVIALILYKFSTTVEASLNRQAISDNFSVRQITITIRTIINGLCYLATFVFGINSIGLFLYSIQLALNSFMESPASNSNSGEANEGQLNAINDATKNSSDKNTYSRSSNIEES